MTAIEGPVSPLDCAQRRFAAALEKRARKTADTCESATAPRVRRTRGSLPRHDDSGAHTSLESTMESAFSCNMETAIETLPDDVGALRASIAAARKAHDDERSAHAAERSAHATERAAHAVTAAAHKKLEELHAKLEQIVSELRRAHFGRKSERIDDAQLALALEDLETAAAKLQAEATKAAGIAQTKRTPKPRTPRAEILATLPREEVVNEPESTTCPCCSGALHKIGEGEAGPAGMDRTRAGPAERRNGSTRSRRSCV